MRRTFQAHGGSQPNGLTALETSGFSAAGTKRECSVICGGSTGLLGRGYPEVRASIVLVRTVQKEYPRLQTRHLRDGEQYLGRTTLEICGSLAVAELSRHITISGDSMDPCGLGSRVLTNRGKPVSMERRALRRQPVFLVAGMVR